MYNILICDDEKDIVSALSIYLSTENYNIFTAYTGQQALDIVAKHDIHLILMDIMMPQMDGIAATVKLRETSNIPIILLTAKSEDSDKILGLNIGADDYITKPFNPIEVLARVRSQLRRYTSLGGMAKKASHLTNGGIEMDDESKIVTVDGEVVSLTPSEYNILKLLMENPAVTLERELAARQEKAPPNEEGPFPPFRNEPPVDFTIPEKRKAYAQGIAAVRAAEGRTLPLYIDGKDVVTETLLPTVNPADPGEVLAQVCQAGREEIDRALAGAKAVFPAWRDTPPLERAQYMHKAAAVARRRIYEMAALQTLEVGKPWEQAYGDVGEGIDFLEYYARDMLRLSVPRRMGRAPGEHNVLFYQPKGVAAVIAPWNFPFAIAMGMVSAAIVTGNPVVFKPSSLSSAIGYNLVEIFKEVGLPAGVFNYCPGQSSVMGDYLVEHPDISLICFTGSMDVGLHIVEKAAKVQPGQRQVKRVIAEMGGKNATIVDDDADLDEAVSQVVYSAFGFQGQKCSACSRVIVLDAIYDTFVQRLALAAQSLRIGPAENPENFLGPLADASLQKNVLEYIEIAEAEGKTLVKRSDLPDKGAYVPLLIVEDVMPEHRIAQEEVFGPVLAVMRAKDFDEALELALSTRFALTGAVFSRSPENLAKAREKFRVGNLYLNKGSTGAMVGRQPFGGFNMSGVGSKTGGPDYLLQFMDPRCVTENTIRRGFTPIAEDDDWV